MLRLAAVGLAFIVGCAATALDRVNDARPDAARGPREAQTFAAAVVDAWKQGEYADEPKAFADDSTAALDLLDRTAKEGVGPDAATSLAWQALILRAQGRDDEATGELERSFALAPNAVAGEALVLRHGEQRDSVAVGQVCAALCPSITDVDERMRLIGVCRQSMHAESAAEETAWMPPALATWYREESRRREAEAKRRQEQERRAKLKRVQIEQCNESCRREASFCQMRCMRDPGCQGQCVALGNNCTQGCGVIPNSGFDP